MERNGKLFCFGGSWNFFRLFYFQFLRIAIGDSYESCPRASALAANLPGDFLHLAEIRQTFVFIHAALTDVEWNVSRWVHRVAKN